MTSKLICPFCKEEIISDLCLMCDKIDKGYTSGRRIYKCNKCGLFGNKELWQALIQAKQDLEIATKALKEMQHWLGVIRCSVVSHLNNQNNTLLEHYETDPTVQNIDKAKSILKQYLEQIEHKE